LSRQGCQEGQKPQTRGEMDKIPSINIRKTTASGIKTIFIILTEQKTATTSTILTKFLQSILEKPSTLDEFPSLKDEFNQYIEFIGYKQFHK
jgi:hypothetical protein